MNQSQQNGTDHSLNFFWYLAIVAATFIIIWLMRPQWLVVPIFYMRSVELDIMIFVSGYWNQIAGYVHLPLINTHTMTVVQSLVMNAVPKTMHFSEFSQINDLMGNWIRWPTMAILTILATMAYFRHSTMLFRQRHDMNSLKALERENWPQIEPVLSLDLIKEDIEKGPWAMAKVPLEYCKEHQIVTVEEKNHKKIWQVDKGPASRLLAMQLGPLWKDLFNLPIHIKALIVIFIAKSERQYPIAKKFLSQIARSASSGRLDFTGVNEQLMTYQHSKLLAWLRPRHAYVRTMMASLLGIARADGVLATAEFLWLKPIDRKLWYTLNSVGRQTAVIEVSGIFAHWKAEKALGRAMTTPMVKEAVKALDICMKDILYTASGEKWRSNGD
jgi:intracellular multiplication protein IcmP